MPVPLLLALAACEPADCPEGHLRDNDGACILVDATTEAEGDPDLVAGAFVTINEVIARAVDGVDRVELYNAGDTGASVSLFECAELVDVSPGAFVVLTSTATCPWSLGESVSVTLLDDSGAQLDKVSLDAGDSPEGGSYGRVPDGVGQFYTLVEASPGSSNGSVEQAVCGNGVQEVGEVCDGDDVGDWDCVSLGFFSGQAACSEDCGSVSVLTCVALPSEVVISEIIESGSSSNDSLVLACDATSGECDVGGWSVVDRVEPSEDRALVFGDDATLADGAERTFYEADLPFRISRGETIVLRDREALVRSVGTAPGRRNRQGEWVPG